MVTFASVVKTDCTQWGAHSTYLFRDISGEANRIPPTLYFGSDCVPWQLVALCLVDEAHLDSYR